jgi:hypothetical protein
MRKLNLDVLINPEKYKQKISVDKIVADPKVSRRGIKRYKIMLSKGESLGTIIVIKHPRKDVYAVVDGHHRLYAQLESGIKKINCAVVGNFSSFMFYLRIPILKFREDLDDYLKEFLKNPEKLRKQR